MTTETEAAAQTPPWIPSIDDFGSRLALVRHRMGWNVKEAARECGLAAATWRLWEEGGSPRNIITTAMAISNRTGCDYLWLVHGPNRGATVRTFAYVEARVIGQIGAAPTDRLIGRPRPAVHSHQARRSAAPSARVVRPMTPVAV